MPRRRELRIDELDDVASLYSDSGSVWRYLDNRISCSWAIGPLVSSVAGRFSCSRRETGTVSSAARMRSVVTRRTILGIQYSPVNVDCGL